MNIPFIRAHHRAFVYGGLAGLVVVIAGIFFLQPKDATGAMLTIVAKDFTKTVSVSGNVVPAQDVTLGFAQSGRVSGVYANVGGHVSAGTLLAQVENGDLAAAVVAKQAALAGAQAKLASLQAGTRPESIAVASSTVVSAQAALADALQNAYTVSDDSIHNKTDQMFTNPRVNPKIAFSITSATLKNAVEKDRSTLETMIASWATARSLGEVAPETAQQHLAQVTQFLAELSAALGQAVPDQSVSSATLAAYGTTLATARTSVNAAVTSLTTTTAALDAAEKNLTLLLAGTTVDDLAAQKAAVEAASAEVQNAQAALAKTQVRAPFAGIVTQMDAKVGSIVSPTSDQIAMQSDGVFQIDAYIPEVAIAGVTVGDVASTTLDAYGSDVVFPAKVIAVDPAETIRQGVPTYKTTLVFLSKDSRIRSGMTANSVIITGVLPHAIVIPEGAIGHEGDNTYVSLKVGEKAQKQLVTVGGHPSLGQVEIVSGLASGDTILLTP